MREIIPKELRAKTRSNVLVVAMGIAIYAAFTYLGSILGFVKNLYSIMSPFVVGIVVAFLLNAPLRRLEKLFTRLFCKKKPHPLLVRRLGVTCSMLLLVLIITVFTALLVPQLAQSVRSIIFFARNFLSANADQINDFLQKNNFISREGERLVVMWENVLNQTLDYTTLVLNNVVQIADGIYSVFYQIFIGLIASVYILLEKDRLSVQAKKLCYALFSRQNCESLIQWTRRANRICSGFLVGKIVDSLIIGVLCYIGMRVFRIEYPLLISVIIGVTNILPFFGPFIGAIPSILILLIVNPYSALWFAIFILVLQQVDGNIIGPRILGGSMGISPLWIMFAIIVGSGLFGFIGMLVSVPAFALFYAILQTVIDAQLRRRHLRDDEQAYAEAPEKSPEVLPEGEPDLPEGETGETGDS